MYAVGVAGDCVGKPVIQRPMGSTGSVPAEVPEDAVLVQLEDISAVKPVPQAVRVPLDGGIPFRVGKHGC